MVREIEKRKFKIKKIGNSKGIIIDKDIAEFLNLEVGDWVEITLRKINLKLEDKDK